MAEIKPRTVYLMQRTDKIYDGTEIYVGSTSKTLRRRLFDHRGEALRIYNESNKLYTRMQEVGVYNWEITLLETNPLCDKREIFILEKKWIEKLKPNLNMRFPIRENNEKSRERARNYILKNLEEKRYHCNLCEKTFEHSGNLKRHLKTSKHFWKYIYSVD